MKGVWRCDAVLGGTANTRLLVCRHWTVHNGNRGRPARIDVHCLRCGTRHQHVPRPRDGRGRSSRMRYVRFPSDVTIDILVDDCARRNRAGRRKQLMTDNWDIVEMNDEQLSNEFVQASELPNSENVDLVPKSHELVPAASDPGANHGRPSNVNDTPPLIVRVWRRIVTFFRKTSP